MCACVQAMACNSNPCLSIASTMASESSPGSMQIARLVFSQPTTRVCCWKAVVVISSMIIGSGQWSVVSGQWSVVSGQWSVQYECHETGFTTDDGQVTTDNELLASKSIIPHRSFRSKSICH